jgi:3-oxoacid CoA-transferase subunit A
MIGRCKMEKIYDSFEKAVADIPDGASVMMMSFLGPGGSPQNLTLALRDQGAKDLDVYPCPNFGISAGLKNKPGYREYLQPDVLVGNGQVKKAHVTWARAVTGEYSAFELAALSGEVEVEMIPLGVYAHRLRAGGTGVPAFYCPTGVGTVHEQGKEKRVINGREYLLEYAIRADFGFVRAFKADRMGNLVYNGTARCFNPLIAKACDVTIAEVDEIVDVGELDAEHIVTPGIYIDRIVRIPKGGLK